MLQFHFLDLPDFHIINVSFFNIKEERIYGLLQFVMHVYLQSCFETASSINVSSFLLKFLLKPKVSSSHISFFFINTIFFNRKYCFNATLQSAGKLFEHLR